MRTILYLIRKEFTQIFRNRTMLPIIFILPIVQLIVLVSAATLEMKKIDLVVVDKDLSEASRALISKFQGSPFYHITQSTFSIDEAESMLLANRADMVLHIPPSYEKNLLRSLIQQVDDPSRKIQVLVNAINATSAGLINAYTGNIIRSFSREYLGESTLSASGGGIKMIKINTSFWYNPELNYKTYMLPGILVILVTILGMFLGALNLVREKEMGTIEQINVSPIKKYQFIIGKLVPFWFIAIFMMFFGLAFGMLVYRIPFVGSFWLLLAFTSVYLLVALGLGLFLSTISNNQQQLMFIAFFFLLTFVLMSGIFTPIESMPDWAIKVNVINPIAYFMKVIRMIILKGSEFSDIRREFFSLLVYAVAIISLAVWRYRKVA